MSGIRLDVSALVGIITQAVLFGLYQVLFFACIYVLLNKRSGYINWPFFTTAIVMWILIGTYFGVSWSRIMDAFIGSQSLLGENPNAISEYFENLSNWKEIFRSSVYQLLTVVADSLFTYRLYVVWGRNRYIVILPILMLCATITSAIAAVILISPASSSLSTPTLTKWVRAFLAVTLVQNVLTTFLIIFRIWWVSKDVPGLKSNSRLWPAVTVLLESGAIYSSTLLVLLGTHVSGSYAQFIAIDMLVPIIGITFNFIIVRVGLGLSHVPTMNSSLTVLRRFTSDIAQDVQTPYVPGNKSDENERAESGEWWRRYFFKCQGMETSTISEYRWGAP